MNLDKVGLLLVFICASGLCNAQENISDLPSAALESDRTLAWIFSEVRRHEREQNLNATFLIGSQGTPIFGYSCGSQMHIDSVRSFDAGYQLFILASIGMLAGQNKLTYDIRVSDILKDSEKFANRTIDDILSTLRPLNGSQEGKILQDLIEKVSGMNYREYVSENIFHACNMKSTTFFDAMLNEDSLMHSSVARLKTTAGDMFNFHRALIEGKLIEKGSGVKLIDILTEEAKAEMDSASTFIHVEEFNGIKVYSFKSFGTAERLEYYFSPALNRSMINFYSPPEKPYHTLKQKLLHLLINN